MKHAVRILTAFALCALCTVAVPKPAKADVIDFEGGFSSLFTYSGVAIVNGTTQPVGSGYYKMAAITPGTQVGYDPFAVSPSTFTWADTSSTFNLDSMLLAGAWGTQTLTLKAYNNGTELYSEDVAVAPDPTVFSPSWQNVDEFRVYTGSDFVHTVEGGDGKHWVMDNLVVETCNDVPSNVPEPGSMALLGLGVAGLVRRCRKAQRA